MIQRILLMIAILSACVTFSQQLMASEPDIDQLAIIRQMEGQTEDLVDALLSKNRQSARDQYQALKANLDTLHQLMTHKTLSERSSRELFTAYSWMRLISIDMQAGAWTGAAIAANQMNGEIIRFTRFPDLMLRDVAWMDYLGREVMLLSMEDMQGNLQSIDLRRGQLDETWKRVREDLIKDFRNKTMVMRGDQIIDEILKAGDNRTLIALSREEHALIEEIEKILGPVRS